MKGELIKMADPRTKQQLKGISNENLIKYLHKNHDFLSGKNRFLIGYFISLYKCTLCKFSVQLKIYVYFAAGRANVPTQEKKPNTYSVCSFLCAVDSIERMFTFLIFLKVTLLSKTVSVTFMSTSYPSNPWRIK